MFSVDCPDCVARLVLLLGLGRLGDGWYSVPCDTANSISMILQREGNGNGIKWMGMDM